MKTQLYDFYCQGFRWFDNYEQTKKNYLKDCSNPNIQQYYGLNVITFNDVTELNIIIQELTLLRDSINNHMSKHPNIKEEFGTDGIDKPNTLPYWGEPIFKED